MASREETRQAVQAIAAKYGFVGDEVMEKIGQWDPEVRRMIEESNRAKDHMAGHSIKTLAERIYGSDARFIFELLQNADDSRFTRAMAANAAPSISFNVYPDRIVVECNEDGFTTRDLEAICAVGKSTKSGSHGYIGAKGIGFKSVFIAAWKVEIQSGHFSFFFRHEKKDEGLGMVLPIWQNEPGEELVGPLTRMTLHLHHKGEAKDIEHLRSVIFKQLGDLQQTCLLFLRNLKKIKVAFHDEHGGLTSAKEFTVGTIDSYRVLLKTISTNGDGDTHKTTKCYHVTRHVATELSRSGDRTLEAAETSSSAEVVLAFPLTNDYKPRRELQHIFAFLPIKESEFKFLIHSDFETSASRQDIVTTSQRNIDLLDGIAAAFLKAVLEFWEHPDLCYTWPLFLPDQTASFTSFWSSLTHKIKSLISTNAIIRSRHRNDRRRISEVFILRQQASDDNGEPLFDDPGMDLFISPKYPSKSREALRQYGLEVNSFRHIFDLMELDLQSMSSKLKSGSTDQKWHSAVAKMLCAWWPNLKTPSVMRIRRMCFIPLRNGKHVAAKDGSIFLPMAKGVELPPYLDLRILDPAAAANKDRRALFELLGIGEIQIFDARDKSFDRLSEMQVKKGANSNVFTLADSKAHLEFLYLTEHHLMKDDFDRFESVYLYGDDNSTKKPASDYMYLPCDDHPFGAKAVLAPTSSAPGYRAIFAHPAYFEREPSSDKSCTWRDWFVKRLALSWTLQIQYEEGLWPYIVTHRPEKALGVLHHTWSSADSRDKSKLVEVLKTTDARKFCGRDLGDKYALAETWLPLAELKARRSRFLDDTELFPFLDLGEDVSETQLRTKWNFLHKDFGVGQHCGMAFYASILYWLRESLGRRTWGELDRPERVLHLYLTLDTEYTNSPRQQQEQEWLRDELTRYEVILCPDPKRDWCWISVWDALWDGPEECMYQMQPLKHLYKPLLEKAQLDNIERFFKTLGIESATWNDLTSELEEYPHDDSEMRERPSLLADCTAIYKYLDSMDDFSSFQDDIREFFRDRAFILARKNRAGDLGWFKLSECLWASSTDIRGRATLNDTYGELKSFFTEKLGVEMLNLQMVYNELKETPPNTSIDQVKHNIACFSSLLRMSPDTDLDPRNLLKAKILPVKYPDGSTGLVSEDVAFAIVDRTDLAAHFDGKINMLDYDLGGFWRLKPFFEWAKLTGRYLSASVKESTSTSGGNWRPVIDSKRKVKRKAHALLRVAATYRSPRYALDAEGLYRLLRNSETIETNDISRMLVVFQNGNAVHVEISAGDAHVADNSGQLSVFVPADPDRQEFSFAKPLPTALADWLMRDPMTSNLICDDPKLVAVVSSLLSVNSTMAVRSLLEEHGIVEVPLEDQDEPVEPISGVADHPLVIPSIEHDQASDDENKYAYWSSRSSSSGLRLTPDTVSSRQISTHSVSRIATHRSSGGSGRARTTATRTISPEATASPLPQTAPYQALLERVVASARAATFPSRGAFDMSALLASLPEIAEDEELDGFSIAGGVRSSSKLERDRKVGAAGELYVFELLSSILNPFPGWYRAHWKSTIRHYAAAHPDYADLQPWVGRETADFVFNDSLGCLTTLLINKGYLEDEWRGETPRFWIEVKATTGSCGAPLYMSKAQYRRMVDVHARMAERKEVYVIMRVFGLGSDQMGMVVYLDPEQRRRDGSLVFEAETWTVVPGAGVDTTGMTLFDRLVAGGT